MNDEETVALIAGGHTFGKTHGAGDATLVGPSRKRPASKTRASAGKANSAAAKVATRSPAASKSPGPRRQQNGATTIFKHLFSYEWELTKSPAGANQWKPKNGAGAGTVPDPHDNSKRRSSSRC